MIADTCCFTGHRPQKLPWKMDEAAPACRAFLIDLRTQLVRLIGIGYTHFLSGMAQGADILFAETVLSLKESFPAVTLEAAVPHPGQTDGWPADQRARYESTLAACDTVTVVSAAYSPDCMMKRNRYMVDRAGVVLAFCRSETGGTAATVRYARKKNRAVIKL